jgi:hypothetical protein
MKATLNSSNTLGDQRNGNDAFVKMMFNEAEKLTHMDAGETVAHNLGDIQKTSQMLKNAVSIMGANAGMIAPATEKLDQFVALGPVETMPADMNSSKSHLTRPQCLLPDRFLVMLRISKGR